jgi:hypothetical protein
LSRTVTDEELAALVQRITEAAPETGISNGPFGWTRSRSASFTFSSNDWERFECSVDGAAFATCALELTLTDLLEGTHTLRVRAVDAAGHIDPTPAVRRWGVDFSPPSVAAPTVRIAQGSRVDSSGLSFSFSGADRIRSAASLATTSSVGRVERGRASRCPVRRLSRSSSDADQEGTWASGCGRETRRATSPRGRSLSRSISSPIRKDRQRSVIEAFGSPVLVDGVWRSRQVRASAWCEGEADLRRQSLSLVSTRARNRGKAAFYLDGRYIKTIDLFARDTQPRRVVFSQRWAVASEHTATLRVLGRRDARSTGTRIDLDAFLLIN